MHFYCCHYHRIRSCRESSYWHDHPWHWYTITRYPWRALNFSLNTPTWQYFIRRTSLSSRLCNNYLSQWWPLKLVKTLLIWSYTRITSHTSVSWTNGISQCRTLKLAIYSTTWATNRRTHLGSSLWTKWLLSQWILRNLPTCISICVASQWRYIRLAINTTTWSSIKGAYISSTLCNQWLSQCWYANPSI